MDRSVRQRIKNRETARTRHSLFEGCGSTVIGIFCGSAVRFEEACALFIGGGKAASKQATRKSGQICLLIEKRLLVLGQIHANVRRLGCGLPRIVVEGRIGEKIRSGELVARMGQLEAVWLLKYQTALYQIFEQLVFANRLVNGLLFLGEALFLSAVVLLEVAGFATALSVEHLSLVLAVSRVRGLAFFLVAAATVALCVEGSVLVRALVDLVAGLHLDHF